MPREPKLLVRDGGHLDAEKLFILSFEGEKTEVIYFEDFRNSKIFNNSGLIELVPLKRAKNTGTDPFSVKKLLSEAKQDFSFKKTDEFWLIIDRDHWESIHKLSFDELVEECNKESNFFIAMSNPCFEIWLILHLKELKDFSNEEIQAIYENERVSANKRQVDKVISDLSGKSYNKKPDPNIFIPQTNLAIERARLICVEGEDYPKSVGTHVFKLIEKLI